MSRYIICACVLLLVLGGLPGALAQSAPSLSPYTQTIVTLDDTTPQAEFTFAATEGAVWSFSAAPLVANLNPILRILGPEGDELAANDDQIRRSPTARLEAWRAPATGDYTLVLTRRGRGAGQVRLVALGDNYSLPLGPLPPPDNVTLTPGRAYTLADRLDVQRLPLRARFNLSADFEAGDRVGVQMQSRLPGGEGSWLLVLGPSGATLQRTTPLETATDDAPAFYEAVLVDVDTPLSTGAYELVLATRTLLLRIDGERALSLGAQDLPPWFGFFQAAGTLRAVALPDNNAALRLGEPYASAPYYGTVVNAGDALPPAPPEARLLGDGLVPLVTVQALRAREDIQTERPGELLFSQPDAVLETSATGFSSLPLEVGAGVSDMVLAFTVRVRGDAPSAACGVGFRSQDEQTFSAAILSAQGEAYLLEVDDGALRPPAFAQDSPWLNPGLDAPNQIILVVEGAEARWFANGVYLGAGDIARGRGGVSLLMVLETPTTTRCVYDNVWAWSLD